jgi:ribosomal-protein-alanine N-acetyltransferase
MKTDQPLVGESIYLRTLNPDDASPAYLSWLCDPEINQYLEVRFMPSQTITQLRDFIEKTAGSNESLLLGMFQNDGSRHIGNIKLGPVDWNHRTADIGLLLGDREQWGKGFATTAIALVSKYAFRELKLAKLTAGCYAENRGSMNAFFKAGFTQEGIKVSQWQVGDRRQDGIMLGMVNPDLDHSLRHQEISSRKS